MSEARLGPARELEVELSPRAEFHAQLESTRTCQGRREGKNRQWLQFLKFIVTKVALCLCLHSRTALAMRFNGLIRWDI